MALIPSANLTSRAMNVKDVPIQSDTTPFSVPGMSSASTETLALAQSTEEDINGELSSKVRVSSHPTYFSILNSSYLFPFVSLNFSQMTIPCQPRRTSSQRPFFLISQPALSRCQNFVKSSIGIRPRKVL